MLGNDTRQVDTTDKAVMDDKPLRSTLARSFNRKNFDLVDKFLKHNGSQRLHRHKLPYCSDKAARGVLCAVKAFKLVLEVKHLLLEFFLLHFVFVGQSHSPLSNNTESRIKRNGFDVVLKPKVLLRNTNRIRGFVSVNIHAETY